MTYQLTGKRNKELHDLQMKIEAHNAEKAQERQEEEDRAQDSRDSSRGRVRGFAKVTFAAATAVGAVAAMEVTDAHVGTTPVSPSSVFTDGQRLTVVPGVTITAANVPIEMRSSCTIDPFKGGQKNSANLVTTLNQGDKPFYAPFAYMQPREYSVQDQWMWVPVKVSDDEVGLVCIDDTEASKYPDSVQPAEKPMHMEVEVKGNKFYYVGPNGLDPVPMKEFETVPSN